MTTLRTVSVRTMLVDCIKRYKEIHEDWYKRPYTEVEVASWSDGCPTVQDIIHYCIDGDYDLSKVFIDGSCGEDCDGYPEYSILLLEHRKATDKEWFDEIASSLSPQWQYDRYKQYMELEKEFKHNDH